jgi:hypothetical protein
MSSEPGPPRRVITPVVTGTRAVPRMGRQGLALLLILLLVGLFFLWRSQGEHQAVGSLPAAQRAAVFSEALERYRVLCRAEESSALKSECAQQAHYLRLFPECDAACRALTDKDVPGPTR